MPSSPSCVNPLTMKMTMTTMMMVEMILLTLKSTQSISLQSVYLSATATSSINNNDNNNGESENKNNNIFYSHSYRYDNSKHENYINDDNINIRNNNNNNINNMYADLTANSRNNNNSQQQLMLFTSRSSNNNKAKTYADDNGINDNNMHDNNNNNNNIDNLDFITSQSTFYNGYERFSGMVTSPTMTSTTTAEPASSGLVFTGESANVSRLIESLMKGYDKRLRPNYKGNPVEVGITMHILSISSISEVNMDFTLDFYFRQHWHDERLTFENSGEDELCISNEMLDKIWWPDTFFANAKSAKFHTATTKNAFLRIKPNGWITQSLRLTVTAMCNMNLRLFPMDMQICPLEIESYAYSTRHIKYFWKDGFNLSVDIQKEVQMPQFDVKGYRVIERLENTTTGSYSRLACQLWFVRSLGYYVIQIYVPSSLIVVLSWISFWLDRNAAPARVALGITTVLTLTTFISSTNASLPKISYLKSIDVYLVTCFIMVFAALLEYAAVSFIGNKPWIPKNKQSKQRREILSIENAAEGKRLALSAAACKGLNNRQMRKNIAARDAGEETANLNQPNSRRYISMNNLSTPVWKSFETAEPSLHHTDFSESPNKRKRLEWARSSPDKTFSKQSNVEMTGEHKIDMSKITDEKKHFCPPNSHTSFNQDQLSLSDFASSSATANLTKRHLTNANKNMNPQNQSNYREGNNPPSCPNAFASNEDTMEQQAVTGGAHKRSASKLEKKPKTLNKNIVWANNIDKYSRMIFPFLFAIFLITYWIVYTDISRSQMKLDFVLIEQSQDS